MQLNPFNHLSTFTFGGQCSVLWKLPFDSIKTREGLEATWLSDVASPCKLQLQLNATFIALPLGNYEHDWRGYGGTSDSCDHGSTFLITEASTKCRQVFKIFCGCLFCGPCLFHGRRWSLHSSRARVANYSIVQEQEARHTLKYSSLGWKFLVRYHKLPSSSTLNKHSSFIHSKVRWNYSYDTYEHVETVQRIINIIELREKM